MADDDKVKEAEDAKDENEQDTEEGAEGEAGEGKKKSKKKLFIIIGLVILLLAGGGAGAFFAGVFETNEDEEAIKAKEQAVYYSMPEMIINLSTPGKNASFLKATVILELQSTLDAVTVEANLPRLMDAFNTYVRELRPSDLSGSAGITRLREELLLRANKALEPMKINDVLFKEIVVQ